MKPLRSLLTLTTLATVVSLGALAHADAPAPAPHPDPEVARLLKEGHSLKWNAVPAGSADRHGHGEVLIGAPPERVRMVLTNYSQYGQLMPDKFNNARIVAKENGQTDVFMKIPLKGALLRSFDVWQILRFGEPQQTSPGVWRLEGNFVRGNNVEKAHLLYTWKQITPTTTLLKVDILIRPSLPTTQSMIDEELRDAARQAVDAIHDKAQGNTQTVTQIST
jgi:hypothetical protein